MITFGELNKVSKELTSAVPKLGATDSAEYKLLGISPDPDNKGMWNIPFAKSVPARVLITDPKTNEIAEIAYIKRIKSRSTKNGRVDEPDIQHIAFMRATAGRIILHGGNPEDRLLHEFLFLSPYNTLSPCRVSNISPVYEYVDAKANAKKGMDTMNRKIEAMRVISELTPANGLFDYAYLISRVKTEEEDVARFQLATFAENTPDRFFDIIESVDSQLKVTYLRALSQGIISYDVDSGTIRWAKNQEIICALPKAITNREEGFSTWAKAGGENMKIVDTISQLVSKKKK